jgi:hypothetical protein
MNGDPIDLSRREFVLAGVASISGGSFQVSDPEQVNAEDFEGAALLIGPTDARPAPGDPFFEDKVFNGYIYEDETTGARSIIRGPDYPAWRQLRTALVGFDNENLPSDPPTGQLLFDTDRGLPAWWDRDHYEWPTFVDNADVETSDDQVANTTVETEVLRASTNPGGLIAGRVFILRNFGVYSTAASTDNFTYRVYIGEIGSDPLAGEGTLISSSTTVQENVTEGPWQAKTTTVIESEGTSGEADTHTEARFNDTASDDHTRNITIDTTTAAELVATIQWNNAKADNVARQDMSYLQQQG